MVSRSLYLTGSNRPEIRRNKFERSNGSNSVASDSWGIRERPTVLLMLRAPDDVSELLGIDEQYEPLGNDSADTGVDSDADFDAEIRA